MWTRDFLYACICFLIALGLLVPCMLFRVGILSWLLGRELEQQDARLRRGGAELCHRQNSSSEAPLRASLRGDVATVVSQPAPAPAPAPVSDTEESFA